ncbi:hypothetical protein BY996DRAFT_6433982 [Phakopsora pachyrhizi]|nr:hypothetical protein BY996DRAFT_6433982 [Phakopsora pachyrhizi]
MHTSGGPMTLGGGFRNLLGEGTSLLSGNGLHDLLEGVEVYDSSAPPNGPLPPQTPGDAPWTQSLYSYQQKIACPDGTNSPRGIVLLVPCTTCKSGDIWPKTTYPQGLLRNGYSYCWVDLPNNSLGDLQLSAEFVAYAITNLAQSSGRKVGVLSYSQGGANVSLKFGYKFIAFWPSLKAYVWGFVAIAPPMRGTAAPAACTALVAIGGCFPALLQMNLNSEYMRALNAGTDAGSGAYAQVPTTTVYSANDEIVTPNIGRNAVSYLEGASNIMIQNICGVAHVVDHFLMPADPGVYAVVMDALLNQRPAMPSNIDASLCNRIGNYLGGAASLLATDLRAIYRTVIGNTGQRVGMILSTLSTLQVPAEPYLQMYVCQRGYATGCTPYGFRGGNRKQFILNDLPIGRTLGGLLQSKQKKMKHNS